MPEARRLIEGSPLLGASLAVRLDVRADTGTVRVTDDLGPGLERSAPAPEDGVADASSPGGVVLRTDPGGRATAGYRVRLGRRGDLRFGAIHVRTLGPWGLAWRETVIGAEARIRVQPGLDELRKQRLPGLRPSLVTPGLRRVRRWGEGSEFESLREYQPGDDPRTVDWKASARRPDLLVRHFQVERNQTVVLAIDAGRLMRERIGDRERLDHALAAALLVAERARSYGDRVGVLVFDDEVRRLLPARKVAMGDLAETFASVRSRLVEPNYPMAFATLGRAFRKRSLILLFTDVIDAAASRALMGVLVSAASRHLPVAVALRNPQIEEATRSAGASPESARRRAAGEALLEAREVALQSMRRAGVHTVDVLPPQASAAVLEKYAEVKRRGLL